VIGEACPAKSSVKMGARPDKAGHGADSGYHSSPAYLTKTGGIDIDSFYGVSRDHNPSTWAKLNGREMPASFDLLADTEDLEYIDSREDLSVVTSLIPSSKPKQRDCSHHDVEARSMKKKRKRVVLKDGSTNVIYKNISKKWRTFFADLYTTLLDASWMKCILMFALSFYGSWVIFGVIYYIISLCHGDLDETKAEGHIPCILEAHDFTSCFLFSLETQHTIGYGTRQTTTECPHAIITMSLQSVLGCLIQAFMVGLVFSKLSRPRNRSKTVIFSNNAVIYMRNRRLCLVIRIGDLRDDNFILGCQISVKILRRRITEEGEIFHEMKMLKVDPDTTSDSCTFFVWPLDLIHVIEEDSPFYDICAEDLARERFELLVVMEGTIETSSMNFQARTSYMPNEILWGHRFEPMMLFRKDHNKFHINFSAFHSTYEVDTPTCTARTLENLFAKMNNEKVSSPLTRVNTTGGPLGPQLFDQVKKRENRLSTLSDNSTPSVSRRNSNSMRRSASMGPSLRRQKSVPTIDRGHNVGSPPVVGPPREQSLGGGEKVRWLLGEQRGQQQNGTAEGKKKEETRGKRSSMGIGESESGASLESASREAEDRKRKQNYTQL